MKVWIFGVSLLAAGCHEKQPEENEQQEETNEPEETDTHETAETGDTAVAPACTPTDLTFTVEVRDATGAPATTFGTHDTPTVAGIVTNTCDGDVRVETTTTCLVTKWVVTGTKGAPVEIDPVCNPVATSWTVPALGVQEATGTLEAMPKDDYTVQATFGYQDTTGTATFTVQ
jgi:hypothetical protein